jgi:hypothetical protein
MDAIPTDELVQRVFTRVLEDTNKELSRPQVTDLVARTLGITSLEVAFAVGIKNTIDYAN